MKNLLILNQNKQKNIGFQFIFNFDLEILVSNLLHIGIDFDSKPESSAVLPIIFIQCQ